MFILNIWLQASKPGDSTTYVSGKNASSECCWGHSALAPSPFIGTPCVWRLIFGRFLLRLSRIKRPQVMSMVKFSPIALNFGYDFGTHCIHFHCCVWQTNKHCLSSCCWLSYLDIYFLLPSSSDQTESLWINKGVSRSGLSEGHLYCI